MPTLSPKEITRLLVAWGDGDEAALDKLTPDCDEFYKINQSEPQ